MKVIYLQNDNHQALVADLGKFFGAIIAEQFMHEAEGVTATMYADGKACVLCPDKFDDSVFISKRFVPKNPEFVYAGFEPLPAETVAREQVEADIAFGKNLVLDYLAENKMMDLPTMASVQQLQKLQAVKMLLESGAIKAAHDLLTQVTTDEVFTESRKNIFITKLESYINGTI